MSGAQVAYRYFSAFKAGSIASDKSRSLFVRVSGFYWREDSSVSNIQIGENPIDRMNKVSHALIISVGLVEPKHNPNWMTAMDKELIFSY